VTEPDDFRVPEFALIRFIDATIEPGFSYQYRIKIKMANPNYGKHNLIYPAIGQDEDIVAPEFTVTPKVAVPSDTEWYVTDDKPDKDRLVMQIHHWVYSILTDKEDQNSLANIGDWTIQDRSQAHRGEYIGRIENARLPTWKVNKERYEWAVNTRSRSTLLPVDFTARRSNDPNEDPFLLVDYSGSKNFTFRYGTKKITEEMPVEALVLTPDGKLIVRRQSDDIESKDRKDRFESWRLWMVRVLTGKAGKHDTQDIFNRQFMPNQQAPEAGRRRTS
jgi:hypothetical protein